MFNFTVKSSIHNYEVLFIDNTKKALKDELKKGDILIIDRKIMNLYGGELKEALDHHYHISIEATEPQKSYQGVMPVIQELIDNGFRKNHRLIAIGGGITQDVTAFMASILYRGVNWYFFPTSLLAQGDSCIGSKTSINFNQYKNQVGGFYPPNKIFINTAFLDTLSLPELQSGLGEMLHYFIVAGEEDFKRFKNDYPLALKDKEVLKGIIARSLAIKKSYIEIDEFDKKERQVFNYGHTFGHAIESLTGYRVPHGIAVSYGMDMANFISVKKGYLPDNIRQEVRGLVQQIWSGTHIADISLHTFTTALSKDKKNVDAQLGLILNKGYGKIFKDLTPLDDTFISWLKEYFDTQLN